MTNGILFTSSYGTEITVLTSCDIVRVKKNGIAVYYKVNHEIITGIKSKVATISKR